MTDYAAKLLNELMGRNRNLLPDEQKVLTIDSPEVCRYHLVSVCPHDLFTNTKVDIGPCSRIHDDTVKKEYTELPKHKKVPFEDDFLKYCQTLINDVERKIQRSKKRLELQPDDEKLASLVPPQYSRHEERMQALTERINKLVGQMEELGNKGEVEEAQAMVRLVESLKEEKFQLRRATEGSVWHQAAEMAASQEKQMAVCEICGAFLITAETDQTRIDDHLGGKQHLGYARLKEVVEEIREGREKEKKEKESERDREREERAKERLSGAARERDDRDRGRGRDDRFERDDRGGRRNRERELCERRCDRGWERHRDLDRPSRDERLYEGRGDRERERRGDREREHERSSRREWETDSARRDREVERRDRERGEREERAESQRDEARGPGRHLPLSYRRRNSSAESEELSNPEEEQAERQPDESPRREERRDRHSKPPERHREEHTRRERSERHRRSDRYHEPEVRDGRGDRYRDDPPPRDPWMERYGEYRSNHADSYYNGWVGGSYGYEERLHGYDAARYAHGSGSEPRYAPPAAAYDAYWTGAAPAYQEDNYRNAGEYRPGRARRASAERTRDDREWASSRREKRDRQRDGERDSKRSKKKRRRREEETLSDGEVSDEASAKEEGEHSMEEGEHSDGESRAQTVQEARTRDNMSKGRTGPRTPPEPQRDADSSASGGL